MLLPGVAALSEVVESSSAVEIHAQVVAPLCVVLFATILLLISTVEDLVLIANQADILGPSEDLCSPVGVSLIASVAC